MIRSTGRCWIDPLGILGAPRLDGFVALATQLERQDAQEVRLVVDDQYEAPHLLRVYARNAHCSRSWGPLR